MMPSGLAAASVMSCRHSARAVNVVASTLSKHGRHGTRAPETTHSGVVSEERQTLSTAVLTYCSARLQLHTVMTSKPLADESGIKVFKRVNEGVKRA